MGILLPLLLLLEVCIKGIRCPLSFLFCHERLAHLICDSMH
ncbi:hypothetical protein GLYMA_01G104750v4 [Glycine max]|nr:hypothetical protein GLYMA_01G104750v4 [Glycine max]KAH1162504.1 hypothetical protein GYH30_001127 [Glycine max]